MNFLSEFRELTPRSLETSWRAPSNIAFIKYWGKKGHQLPANPSLSMTLKACETRTRVRFTEAPGLSVRLTLDGSYEEKFSQKIVKYLETLIHDLPWLQNLSCEVATENTFPHGTGIASSASGLSAFALCFADYLYELAGKASDPQFFQLSSHLSRLASGSACRSVYGGFTVWGESDLPGSSDLYATPFEVHSELKGMKDSVLIVSTEEKKVSSSQGHGKMAQHFYAETRFKEARANFNRLVPVLKSGDVFEMGKILEAEALSLHAMMLTSPESYILLRPQTLAMIEEILAFRRETKLPVFYTLDAGPNLHLIYPAQVQEKVHQFLQAVAPSHTQRIIHDEVGEGPERC